MTRPSKRGNWPRAEHTGDDLRWTRERVVLQSLDDAEDRHASRQFVGDVSQCLSEERCWDCRDQYVRSGGG